MKLLSPEEERFSVEMATSVDQLAAYRKCFVDHDIFTKKEQSQKATALMRRKDIIERVKELRQMTARALVMNAKQVIDEWNKIALADISELVQYQRVNCRHCYGTDGHYQWKDEEEFAHALAVAIDAQKKELPSDKGGYGFKFNSCPHKGCLNCLGEGVERLFIEDVRNLSPEGKKLYAGVKMTSNGIEIKTRDQDAALLNLAKYYKILSDNDKNESSSNTIEINIKGGLPE